MSSELGNGDFAGEVFSPGEYLADELAARGWTQSDLAGILERPVQWVSEIITGKKLITPLSAMQIAAAFGQDPSTWLTLQARYQLHQLSTDEAHQRGLEQIRRRARINEVIPLTAMRRHGLLPAEDVDLGTVERSLPPDIIWATPDTADLLNPHSRELDDAAGSLPEPSAMSLAQRGWLWAAREAARALGDLPRFEPAAFTTLAADLPHQLRAPEDLTGLPARFAQAGVALVMVEPLPGASDDGLLTWIGNTPLIALSPAPKRFDRIVLQLLTHTAHLVLQSTPGAEPATQAQVAATVQAWILGDPWDSTTPTSRTRLAHEAQQRGICVGLLAGYLQHLGILEARTTHTKTIPTAHHILRTWQT